MTSTAPPPRRLQLSAGTRTALTSTLKLRLDRTETLLVDTETGHYAIQLQYGLISASRDLGILPALAACLTGVAHAYARHKARTARRPVSLRVSVHADGFALETLTAPTAEQRPTEPHTETRLAQLDQQGWEHAAAQLLATLT